MDFDINQAPKNLRTILLALPKRTKITKKYVPPSYIPGTVDSGVKPGTLRAEPVDNWRINMLSTPPRPIKKYVPPPITAFSTGVKPGCLTVIASPRTNDLGKPFMRTVTVQKKDFAFLGKKFLKNMDKIIKESWDTIFYFYARQLEALEKKRKSKMLKPSTSKITKSPKELKAEKEKRIAGFIALRSLPKRVFLPEPLPRSPIADLAVIGARMEEMATPKIVMRKYIRPSIDPLYIDPLAVKKGAMIYTASDRIKELCQNHEWKLMRYPEKIPGAVSRAALRAKISPRCETIAEPKKKAAEKDSDLKENPYDISKYALKAVPTPRTIELAKPIER